MRSLGAIHSAAQSLVRHDNATRGDLPDQDFARLQPERTLPKDEWIRATIDGADEHSPRWRHLLLLGGLLLGFGSAEDDNISRSMRATLESALVTALNATLGELSRDDELGQQTVTLVLTHCFATLSAAEASHIGYDRLLPVLMRSMLYSGEGLRSAYFLGATDLDVQPVSNTQFSWPEGSPSSRQIRSILTSPLISSLGPLSRLIAHTVECVQDSWLITAALDDLEDFARILHAQWRQLKLSEIDASEESTYLDTETIEKTMPSLWKLLRSTLFATVIVLRSVIGRILGDAALAGDRGSDHNLMSSGLKLTMRPVAPHMAAQALHILRHVYFVTTRVGSAATFSQYTFVYLTAIDILTAYPAHTEELVVSIKPSELGLVPQHPVDRCLDLFFLNTAEHFTLTLSPSLAEDLLVGAAAPYLVAGGNNNLLPIFEAAHSLMLATFSAPQNTELTAKHLPFYVDALFKVFPSNLSARQFRMAFKTLLRLATPPTSLATAQPMLAVILLDLLHERATHASDVALFPQDGPPDSTASPDNILELSERAVLTMTVLDTLPYLPLELLDEWLPLTADMVNTISDVTMRSYCVEHFWRVLVAGEMDPDRSELCHAWWTSGGRDDLLLGPKPKEDQLYMMSGALPRIAESSKL